MPNPKFIVPTLDNRQGATRTNLALDFKNQRQGNEPQSSEEHRRPEQVKHLSKEFMILDRYMFEKVGGPQVPFRQMMHSKKALNHIISIPQSSEGFTDLDNTSLVLHWIRNRVTRIKYFIGPNAIDLKKIMAVTFNHYSTKGRYKRFSMASYILAKFHHDASYWQEFRVLLCADDFNLLKKVTKETLNQELTIKDKRSTIARFLSSTNKGLRMLITANQRLLNLIDDKELKSEILAKVSSLSLKPFATFDRDTGLSSSSSSSSTTTSSKGNPSQNFFRHQGQKLLTKEEYSKVFENELFQGQEASSSFSSLITKDKQHPAAKALSQKMPLGSRAIANYAGKYLKSQNFRDYQSSQAADVQLNQENINHFHQIILSFTKELEDCQSLISSDMSMANNHAASDLSNPTAANFSCVPVLITGRHGPIKETDRCIFVLAGRTSEALFPSVTNTTRVIAVLTEKEYTTHKIGPLYDILIVPEQKKSNANSAMITSRRRAAIAYAMKAGLGKIIMLDDNIEHITITVNTANDNQDKETDVLYDFLSHQFQNQNQAFKAIQTKSIRNYTLPPMSLLSGKAFMLDLDFFRPYANGEFSRFPQILMPEEDGRGQQDYFLQNIILAIYEQQGHTDFNFATNKEEISLVRSRNQLNLAAKCNNSISKMALSNEYDAFLTSSCPNAKALIVRAIELQNEQIDKAYQKNDIKLDDFKKMDIVGTLSATYHLDTSPVQTRLSNSEALEMTATLAQKGVLYPHQKDALVFLKDNATATKLVFNMATGTGKTRIQALAAFCKYKEDVSKNVVIICPNIFLAKQTRDAFRSFATNNDLPSELCVPTGKIHGVYSGFPDAISQGDFLVNESLQQSGNILVFCEESFRRLQSSSDSFNRNTSMIIKDESHLLTKIDTSEILTLCFSATPELDIDSPEFVFTRKQGVDAAILCPLLVDDSLEQPPTIEEICQMIAACPLPSSKDTTLQNHKGIIYVNSTPEANSLSQELRKRFPTKNIYEIHSKPLDGEEYNPNLLAFKNDKEGSIAIAVQLLKEGFDSSDVCWSILAKNDRQTPSNYIQMIGRVLRKDFKNPNKIGFVIHSNALSNNLNKLNHSHSSFMVEKWLAPQGVSPPNIPLVSTLIEKSKRKAAEEKSVSHYAKKMKTQSQSHKMPTELPEMFPCGVSRKEASASVNHESSSSFFYSTDSCSKRVKVRDAAVEKNLQLS